MRLSGKTCVITGGGSGIGQAIAWCFAREGCQVAVAGRDEAKLRATAGAYTGQPPILTHRADVANRGDVERLFAWADDQLGHIDILVSNAGINVARRSMAELAPEDWDCLLAVNATGAFNCLQAVLPRMRAQRDGLVIHISSIAGKRAGSLGGVAYNASKFAMTALATTAAVEECKNGIRVTTIFPGEVDTPILVHRPVPVTEEHRAKILKPEDVAAAALMIACLPPRAHVPELVIKPTVQEYV